MNTEKNHLRQQFRAIRHEVSVSDRSEAAANAAFILAQQPNFNRANHVACYLALTNEFDVTPIISSLWQTQKKCYLPLIQPDNSLRFVLYLEGDALKPNRFGILEPSNIDREIPITQLDLVMVPLLAFDRRGQRLGTGGGYYDRTFAKVKEPELIGTGYAAQEIAALPADPWDIRLSAVLTEKEYISIVL